MPEYILEEAEVETPIGTYTVKFVHDEYPGQPEDEGFGLVMVRGTNSRYISINTKAAHADEVASLIGYHRMENAYDGNIYDYEVRSAAAIARYLRLSYGLKGIVQVDDDYRGHEPSANRGESFIGLAWAPDDATNPDEYTRGQLAEWAAWVEGDTFGYQIVDPNGNDVEDGSCWGYYGLDLNREWVMEDAKHVIQYDAAQHDPGNMLVRDTLAAIKAIDAANLVGAGITGGLI